MRKVLSTVQMSGIVVIGEGEKDVRATLQPSLRITWPSLDSDSLADAVLGHPTQAEVPRAGRSVAKLVMQSC